MSDEEFLNSIEEPKIEDNKVVPLGQYGEVDTILSKIVNLGSDSILHEPSCPICSSTLRDDIEKQWIQTQNYDDIKKLLKDHGKKAISKKAIEHHFVFHYDRETKEIQKVEYIGKIQRLNDVNLTTLDRIKLCLSALTERLLSINSIIPDADNGSVDVERIKTAETSKIMASFNQLLKLQASILGEMKSSGELISIPRGAFVKVFNDTITECKTDDERAVVKNILMKLEKVSNVA